MWSPAPCQYRGLETVSSPFPSLETTLRVGLLHMVTRPTALFRVERRMAAEGPYQEELDKRNPYSLPTKHLHPLESKGGSLPWTGETF